MARQDSSDHRPVTNPRRHTGVSTSALLVALASSGALAPIGTALAAGPVGNPADCPWLNPTLSISSRVNMLMQKMTIADEIALVQGNGSNQPYVFYIASNARLCIPALGYEDGPEGVADQLTDVTQLPADIALASTFSRSLALQYGIVIGAEQSAKGSAADLGPTINIDRDPRWGRTFESLSEDPKLTGQIGDSMIVGMQSQDVQSETKHFDAYNQETNRNTQADDVVASQRTLHEIYQPQFQSAIDDAGAAAIMCAYSSVNGFYSCQSHSLLTDVLRNSFNFKGLVMSDYGAVHDISAALAGTDNEQPENTYFGAPLLAAVQDGTIARAVLNTQVAPILAEAFRFGFFNAPPAGTTTAIATTPAHVATATAIAEAGSVLLRNTGGLLPLAPSTDVAVIGIAASTQVTSGGGGSAHVIPPSVVTPLAGIEASATGGVTYQPGLPTDAQLTPIPAADLSTPYSGTNFGGSYTATLTAPETGTYIIGFTNPGLAYSNATLTIDGNAIINNPGTPPVAVYSAAVTLTAGTHRLTLGGSGPTSNLAWTIPSILQAAYIAPAVAAAKAAKVAVVVVADDTETEASDRANLSLPSAQDELIEAVAAANPDTVVVVQAGAPITMPWLSQVASVLYTWYPGQTDGTALSDLLYGVANPSGHLPITFPASLADIPDSTPAQFPGVNNIVDYSEGLLVGYRWYDDKNIQPLFPFGFGLSYTTFSYTNLKVTSSVDGVTPVSVSATVTNTGHVAGSDAAQLYLGYPAAAGEPPRKLVDFQRVTLAPGASTTVKFTINPLDEWWWNDNAYDETAGTYNVYVGDSSALNDLPLIQSYTMTGSIGNRAVTVTVPKSIGAGASGTASVTLSAGGTQTLHGVALALNVPDGWKATPLSSASFTNVLPGQTLTVQFSVTPPAGAVTQNATLYGTANFSPSTCTTTTTAQTQNPAILARAAASGTSSCTPVSRHGGVQVRLD